MKEAMKFLFLLPTSYFLLSFLFFISPVYAHSGLSGPFSVRDQFPIKLLFLSLHPEGAGLLPDAKPLFAARFVFGNTYAVTRPVGDPRVALDYYQDAPLRAYRAFVDAEVLHLTVKADWRILPRLQVGIGLPFIWQGGGFLDATVEGFHKLFRLSNGGREQTPRNAYGVFVAQDGKLRIAREHSPGWHLGDITLRLKTPLLVSKGPWPDISVAGTVKWPTGRFGSLTGSGGVDTQAALLVTQPLGKRAALHANLAYTLLGKSSLGTDLPVRSIFSWMIGFEYLATSRVSVLAQVLSNTSLFPAYTLAPLNRTAYEINAGVRFHIGSSAVFETGLIENLSQHQNTPDIGFHATIGIRR